MCSNNQPMSSSALLKYMQSCNKYALCSVILIELYNPNGLPIFELQWAFGGFITAITMYEGNLYRSNKLLQIEFNNIRSMYDNLKEVKHEIIN